MSDRVQLVCCVDVILREIESGCSRRECARTYWFCLRSDEEIDWGRINRAIIGRWSESGLVWIKKAAHSGSCWDADRPTRRGRR